MNPRLAQPLMDEEVPTARALAIVEALITFFSNNAEPGERLADLIDRLTLTNSARDNGGDRSIHVMRFFDVAIALCGTWQHRRDADATEKVPLPLTPRASIRMGAQGKRNPGSSPPVILGVAPTGRWPFPPQL